MNFDILKKFLGFLILITITACATPVGQYLPGQIFSIENSRKLEFEIEVSRGKGGVRANDKATGEIFSGTYVAIAGGRVSTSLINTATRPTNTPIITTNTTSEIMATSTALLFGDKGTVLDCSINIERGYTPKGIGTCVDQHGFNYRLMF